MTEQIVLFVASTNQEPSGAKVIYAPTGRDQLAPDGTAVGCLRHPTELTLTRRQAIDLELALNKSQYGHSWKHIGDALFNFGFDSNIALNRYGVSEFQLAFLKQLCEDAKVFF